MKFVVYDKTNINTAQELLDRIVNANIAAGEGPQWWYLNILIKYAKQVASIIEYGVYRGQSTAAFLVAKPTHIFSCDIDLSKVDTHLFHNISSKTPTELVFMEKSSLDVNKEDRERYADLIFLDTNHTFDYVQKELRCVKDFANKFIIIHDTNYPKPHRNPHRERLVRDAVIQFTAEAPFEIVEDVREVTGIMVLKRK